MFDSTYCIDLILILNWFGVAFRQHRLPIAHLIQSSNDISFSFDWIEFKNIGTYYIIAESSSEVSSNAHIIVVVQFQLSAPHISKSD